MGLIKDSDFDKLAKMKYNKEYDTLSDKEKADVRIGVAILGDLKKDIAEFVA